MRMIDVGDKEKTARVAVARGFVAMSASTVGLVRRGESEKGDVVAAARLAKAGLSPAVVRRVCGENALQLLGEDAGALRPRRPG